MPGAGVDKAAEGYDADLPNTWRAHERPPLGNARRLAMLCCISARLCVTATARPRSNLQPPPTCRSRIIFWLHTALPRAKAGGCPTAESPQKWLPNYEGAGGCTASPQGS